MKSGLQIAVVQLSGYRFRRRFAAAMGSAPILFHELISRDTDLMQKDCELWFALQVWTQHENSVARVLTQKGIETLSPNKRIWRQWRDRTQACDIPLFPGYVFAKFDPERKLPVVVTPKVQGIVGFGKNPSPIDESEIDAVRKVAQCGLDVETGPALTTGDHVRIVSGPLAGVHGVLSDKRSVMRLVVSVEMINRSISVEVTPDMLVPVSVYRQEPILYPQLQQRRKSPPELTTASS